MYSEILESNKKSMFDFQEKIVLATEPLYQIWRTVQDVRPSLGNLYNYSDNFFKLLI
jgi:hypothetical protein